jgi:hypothetical protein
MATTALNLITESRYLMNDPSKKFYADDELLLYCNAGLRYLASELLLWKTSTELIINSAQSVYSLPYECVLPLFAYDNSGNRRPINEESYRHLAFVQNQFENDNTYSMSPLSLYFDTPTQLQVVVPIDGDIIELSYYYQPTTVVLTDYLPISGTLENMLVLYVQMRAIQKQKGQIGQWDISIMDRVQKQFNDEISRYKLNNPAPTLHVENDDKLYKKGLF